MLISVVIPTYKRSKEVLARSLNSVLNQTYTELEILVVDDSPSNYENRNEIERYIDTLKDKNVILIKHETNFGANVARNSGITNSSGELIAFLDDDDEWYPEKIEKQLKLFSDETVGLVYCSSKELILRNDVIKSTFIRKAKFRGKLHELLYKGNIIGSTSCVIIRRSVFEKVGLFDVNLESAQDYEMYLRISKNYLINFVEGPPQIKYYRHNGERISGDINKAIRSRNYIQEKYAHYLKNNKKANNYFLLNKSKVFINCRKFSKAINCWKDAVLAKPFNINGNFKTLFEISMLELKYLVKLFGGLKR